MFSFLFFFENYFSLADKMKKKCYNLNTLLFFYFNKATQASTHEINKNNIVEIEKKLMKKID